MLLSKLSSKPVYHSVRLVKMIQIVCTGLPDLTIRPWELEMESDEEVEFVDEAEIEQP